MNDDPAPDGGLSLQRTGGVLERVGVQLAGCGHAMKTLQTSLSPGLLASASLDPAAVQRIQELDAIEQTLMSLSAFMVELGARLPVLNEHQLDRLIANIPLANLARHLRSTAQPHPDPSTSGDLEIF